METKDQKPVIAVIGGTGALGSGLAQRWCAAGYDVVIGSRSEERAHQAASELAAHATGPAPSGETMAAAAKRADIVVMTVPFAQSMDVADEIAGPAEGKLIVDVTVPLVPPKVARVQLPPEGSAAVRLQGRLGEEVRLVSAFHNVAAAKIGVEGPVACDVLIFGDRPADRDIVVGLAVDAGLRGLHGGPLANSAAAEALTSVLIWMNRHYGSDGSGIQITGVDETK